MLRLFKLLIVLAVIGFAGLTGYAYLGDLTPSPSERIVPVDLNAG